jgi:hypothetical protein
MVSALAAVLSHQPVDTERTRRYLSAALARGTNDPGIFHNAACAWQRLGDAEQTFRCLELARAHGHPSPEELRDDSDFASIRDQPRFRAIFADLK